MKPAVTYPDAEVEVKDYLKALLVGQATCSIGVPGDRKRSDPPHLQVAVDGQQLQHPVATRATVRLTAWAWNTTEAKRICALAQGLLLAQQEWPTTPVSGPQPTRDPATGSELAFARVEVGFRSVPIT